MQNRSSHQIIGMSTPKEPFSGKKPDVSYFEFFGSSVYFHVKKYSRKKLEPTAGIWIFFGYTNTPHNYRVYFPNNRMTIVRRDIKFNEEKAM